MTTRSRSTKLRKGEKTWSKKTPEDRQSWGGGGEQVKWTRIINREWVWNKAHGLVSLNVSEQKKGKSEKAKNSLSKICLNGFCARSHGRNLILACVWSECRFPTKAHVWIRTFKKWMNEKTSTKAKHSD